MKKLSSIFFRIWRTRR